MQDEQIVALYWQRDEVALRETEQKYGRYLWKIAYNILSDQQDSEESVNDTYLKAWNSMPPHKPERLAAYLSRIARRLAIDRFRTRGRQKRGPSEYTLSLSELEDCVGANTTEQSVDLRVLAKAIDTYLRTLPAKTRAAFIGRYYYMDSIKEVAVWCGMSEANTKSTLYRARQGLKAYLQEEGFAV